MKTLRSIVQFYRNMSLRLRLFLSYMILMIVSLSILGFGYYYKSSDVILENASATILAIVKKSNESLNSKFASVEQIAVNMHLDEDLFAFFSSNDLNKRTLSSEDDRKITRILQKYFPSSEDIYSVNLVTSEYIFGGNPYFWIPKTDFQKSNIYNLGLEAKENTRWIPTYNLLDRFYSTTPESSDRAQLVFSATRLLNISMVKNSILQHLGDHVERPVLVVNYQESMLKKAFAESLSIQGSSYYILTPEGGVVSTSNKQGSKPAVNNEWMQNAFRKKSGTEFISMEGKKMVVCFDTIQTTGWLSVVFIPYDNLLGTVPNMISYTLYSTIVMLILSIVLASFISGRITLPIKKLLVPIKQIGEGHFGTRIEAAGTGELNILIHKFNDMNEKIQQLITENYEIQIKEMEAELRALNFQFNPHFLYNSLNIINYLAIENKQPLISSMLVELSEMLEYTAGNPGEVSFKEDVKYLENYVFIMSRRFEGRFHVEYDIDPGLYNYKVPKFFLQPFIENALIHGLDHIEEGGRILVSGRMEGNTRIFSIEDNGKGMPQEVIRRVLDLREGGEKESIGIDNVNKRVKLLYGTEYGVQIQSVLNEGTKVTITIPLSN